MNTPRTEPKLAAFRGGLEISEATADVLCQSARVMTSPYFAFVNGSYKVSMTMCDHRTLVTVYRLDEYQYPDDHGTDTDYIAQPIGWWFYEERPRAMMAVQQFITDNLHWGVFRD